MSQAQQAEWRVLLIDDDEDDYVLVKLMLNEAQGRKITLEWAKNYAAGQQKLDNGSYDAVLVDYDLGLKTGIELMREFAGKNYPSPFILYTDRGSYAVDLEALQAGATLYLTKSEATSLLLERSLRYAIERKRIEMELDRRLQERTQTLESISDAFYSLDENFCFTYVNHKAASLWGMSAEYLVGKNIWEVFPIGRQTESFLRMKEAMEERQPKHYESHSPLLNTWVDIHVYPTERGISVYFQDITGRKHGEEALLEANHLLQRQATELKAHTDELASTNEKLQAYANQLKRSNEALEDFTFFVSHDLQEPLRNIQALIEQLLEQSGHRMDKSGCETIERLQSTAARMGKMLDGLLAYSHVASRGRTLDQVDLGAITAEVIQELETCRKIVERHNGTITARSEVGKGSTFLIQLPWKFEG